MTGKRLGKRIVSGAMAFIMAASTLMANPIKTDAGYTFENLDSASLVNYATILGGAVDYGIVAPSLKQQGHMETTFATNLFESNSNNDVDFLDAGKTGHFIISGLANDSKVTLGKTSAGTFYIEGPESVVGDKETRNSIAHATTSGTYGNFVLNGEFFLQGHIPTIIPAVNANSAANVNRLISKGEDWSNKIARNSNANRLPDSYFEYTDNGVKIDLTDEGFRNRAVYIDADAELLDRLERTADWNQSEQKVNQGLILLKDPSTVVVFNIEDDAIESNELRLCKFGVISGDEIMYSVTNVNGNRTDPYGGSNVNATIIERDLCESVVWNIRTSKNIQLDAFAGTILTPKMGESDNGMVQFCGGNISGWLLSGKKVDTNGIEFHYLYGGNSQDTLGEMHFAVHKNFTRAYENKANVTPIENIVISEGDFEFIWKEYENDQFSTEKSGTSQKSCFVKSNSDVEFPVIKFNDSSDSAHYVASGSRDFYFRITENPNRTRTGISNSAGYIDVRIRVTCNEEGSYTYKIQSRTYVGSSASNLKLYDQNGTWGSEDNWVDMSGVRFDLGAFYNKVEDSNAEPAGNDLYISKQDVAGKELPGATLNLKGKQADGGTVNMMLSSISVVPGEEAGEPNRTSYDLTFVSGKTPTLIKNLPDGVYTLTETTAPFGYEQAEEITFEIKDGKVLDKDNKNYLNNTVVMVDEAKKDVATYTVNISKRIINTTEELPGATLRIVQYGFEKGDANETDFSKVTLTQGSKDITSTADVCDCGSIEFVSGTEETLVQGLKPGSYVLYEITEPDGYVKAENIGFNIDENGNVTREDGIGVSGNTIIMEDAPKTVVSDTGKLVITKTIEGDVTKGEAEGALQFTITTEVNGITNYVKANGSLTTEETSIGLSAFKKDGGKYTLTLDQLETGSYSVTETITDIDGYKLADVSYTVDNDNALDGKTASVSVAKDATTTVAYTDKYEKEAVAPETGTLVITKTIEGLVSQEEINGALKFTITAVVDGKTNYVQADKSLGSAEHKFGISDFDKDGDQYKLTLNALETGDYTVTETDRTIDGYDVTVTYSVRGQSEQKDGDASVTGAVKKDSTTYVDFKDVYTEQVVTPDTGKLVITKTIEGDVTEEEAKGALQFMITTEVNGTTNYIKADGSLATEKTSIGLSSFDNDNGKYTLTLDKLETGSYTVEETIKDIDGYKLAGVTYKVNDSKANAGETAVARVTKDGTTTVAYTDKYEKEETAPTYGTLVITKTIEGPVTEEEAKGALQFTISTEVNGTTNYVKADRSLTTEKTSIGLSAFDKDGDTYKLTLNKVETGEYNVTETITDIDGKVLISVSNQVTENGSTKTNESSSAKVTVSEDATTTVAYTDEYEEEDTTVETASIQLDKQDIYSSVEIAGATLKVTQNSAADQMSDFEGDGVKLERNGNTVASTRTSNSIEFVSGTTPAVLSGLTDGKYELEEVSAPEGYEVLTTSIKFTIENGDVTEINGPEGQYVLSGKTIIMKDDPVKVETTPTPTPTEEATPTPTEEVTPTPTEEATPTPTAEATPAPTEEVTPTPTEEAAATPVPTEEVTPTPTAEATPAPTEEVTPTPTAEATPAPTEEATPTPTAEATPAPTEEVTPTPTEEVTPTPTPVQPEQPIVVSEILPVAPEQVTEVQWERKNQETEEWEEIEGATEIVYVPTREDEGTEVRARVMVNEIPDVPVYTESVKIETLTGGDYAVTGSIMDEVPKTGPRSAAGFVFAAIGIVAMAAGAVLTLKTRRED